MSEEGKRERSRIVLVVGVDLSDVSEHLLGKARDLVHSVDDAELHVVHVVHPEPLRERLSEPIRSEGVAWRARVTHYARWELQRLCERIVHGSNARFTMHTPVGRAADELARIARDVGADVIVVEAHDHAHTRGMFHRSVVARIAATAPCSVLTIRDARGSARRQAPSDVPSIGTRSAIAD